MPSKQKNLLYVTALVVLTLAVVFLFFCCLFRRADQKIRHVVLISIDTCRADYLSCYGYARPTTPNIDALAQKGYLFSNTITPIPLTLPAHTSMLTGTIPPHHGKHENKDPYFDPSHVTLAGLLKAKGYSTGAFVGSQILNGSFGLDRGFDIYGDRFEQADDSERRAEEVNRAAFAWLEEQKDKPVFLFLHYYDPHDDYEPPEPFAAEFKESPYAGEIAYTDHCIGEVFAKLKSLGMYESSLIIVTGDHGEMLGEHGETTHMYFIYQSAVKVPLIYKLPGSNAGERIDDIAGIVDIVPTVCDLLGIEPPAGIQGENLGGYFSNERPESEERHLFCESLYPTKYEGNTLLCVTSERWKYIQTTRPELYDLQNDPGEQTNLADAEPQRVRILKDRLAQVLEESVRQEKGQEDAPLDAEALKHLHSLGYVGGSDVKEDFSFDQDAEDPKDLIVFHEAFRKVNRILRQKEPVDIRAIGDRLIELRPGFFESYNVLLGIALKQQDYKNAIYFGKRAVALEPNRFKLHNNLGLAYFQIKQDESAARHFKLALELMSGDEADSPEMRVQIHNQLGLLRSRQKKFELAIVHYKESLRLEAKQPAMLNALAQALLSCRNPAIRDPSKALESAQRACELTQSKEPEYLSTLAVAHATIGNLSEAIDILEKALVLAQPKGDQALLAKLRKQLGLIKRALAER
jgi:arylsulfatase A-like enzyme/Flp pilus assembly protein TadD